jgi:hypothetical protein
MACLRKPSGNGKRRAGVFLLVLCGLRLGFFKDGDVGLGVRVFPESEKISAGYLGSPTLPTNSVNRWSERRGSNGKSVFKATRK